MRVSLAYSSLVLFGATFGGGTAFVVPKSVPQRSTLTAQVFVVADDDDARGTRRYPSSAVGRRQPVLRMAPAVTTADGDAGATDDNYDLLGLPARPGRPLKVAIAGGGVGGLTAALYMLKKGFDVTVYEKTSAFARFGGPIQFASNALSVHKEIDDRLFDRVMEKFTFTGIRTCGIKDGLRADGSFRMTDDSLDYLWNPEAPADWFVKFPLKECADLFGLRKYPS